MTNRILSCPYPSNINPLSPNGYMFSIAKLPEVSYFCQEVNLPTLSLGSSVQNTPLAANNIPGDMLDFSPLTVQFLVDENMSNYKAIHNWMVGLGFPEKNSQYDDMLASSVNANASNSAKAYSDAVLGVLGNTGSTIQTIQFIDLYPESLESLTFLSTSQDVQYLVGVATFRYTHYKFI